MGERKIREKGKQKKVIQAKREEEQRPTNNPADAVSRLKANVAQPGDIQALQRTIGNRAVTDLIQRAEEKIEDYNFKVFKIGTEDEPEGGDVQLGGSIVKKLLTG